MKNSLLFILILISLNALGQYKITPFIAGLDNPIAFSITPDGRYLITQKNGLIKAFDSSGTFLQTMYDISDSTYDYGECGLLGICLDPQFPANHFLYIYYNHYDSSAVLPEARIRVLRLTETNNTAGNPLLLFDVPQPGVNHLGGNIHFSNTSNDKLYISIGENAIQANAQLLDNPYGKILRINSDGSIPVDNPFYDDGNPLTGNDDRIWAYGLRNSFDFTFSPVTDSLYATENGPTQDDEVNIIHPGVNYAWPTYTGYTNNPAYGDPIYTWTPTVAPTGILFYSDTLFPQFNNHLLVGIFNNGYIIDLTMGHAPYYDTVLAWSIAFNFGTGFAHYFTTINKGNEGCIYALHGGPSGILYQICPSATGIFSPGIPREKLFSISPVPALDYVMLSWSRPSLKTLTYRIYDNMGRLKIENKDLQIRYPEQQIRINVPDLASGIYFLNIESSDFNGENKLEYEKIIVSKP